MNIPILNTTLEPNSAILGALAVVLVVVIIKILSKFKRKIKLDGVKGQLKSIHDNLQQANTTTNDLYKLFSTLEKRQEEYL